ncbi:ubiquitin specific protease-like protein 2 [Sarcoptes scabiei]|uniref:ubiquitinyl hydrolase 1 n=2 Tax=Sarcoptes scabiei TaxID=52283 RepID=A0A132A6K7_SARSC|nr:ubiquitin specific protease-like protein 2 [Sarcoptes scabiei]
MEKHLILKFNQEFLAIIEDKEKFIDCIMTVLKYVYINSKLIYQTSIWSRAQVVFITLTFFNSWCYSDPLVFDMFFDYKNVNDIIKNLIVEDADQTVRKESCSVFTCLYLTDIDIETLSKTVLNLILTRNDYELRKNMCEDEGLKGLFMLLTVIFKNNQNFKKKFSKGDLIHSIFDCLFVLPTIKHKELPKCKSVQTRAAVFDLLLELVKGDEDNYEILTKLLIDQHRHEKLGKTSSYPWEYWPHDESRNDFVGLINLGATCYMASCMQHIFMLNEVRNVILATNLTSVLKHESILKELQKMFIFLQESERKAYNPKNFCKVYTMDHQPLNVCEQKDMTEFFTDLITKLEEMTVDLKDTVKKHFSGLQSNNVVSLDCPHISQTHEEFYTLRCQVADMRDLYESLNELTVKDTLDGDNMYNCSECGKKVRAEKRACIKKLPKILCFNTMRYTFNMITMTKEKVNTHFSFPFVLDMAPYLETNLLNLSDTNLFRSDSEEDFSESSSITKYDLIGVTVHTGTAEGGHYYSFIQDRDPTSPTRNKWFLFNDAEVKLFDKTQIAFECFGGEMTSKTYDKTNDKFLDFSFEKTNSAYMLFYERCDYSCDNSNQMPIRNSNLAYENISKELVDWIWGDNISFIRDKLIFEHAYFDFVWRVCAVTPQSFSSIYSSQSALISTRLATLFVLETLIHAKEKPTIANWIELLTKQFNNSKNACEWLMNHLAENDWWPIQILFKCSNQMVRQLFIRLCIHVIVKLRPINSSIYLHSLNHQHCEDNRVVPLELYTCVTRFISRLIHLIDIDRISTRHSIKYFHEYFSFLLEYAKQGDEECRFLLSIDTIPIVINFYLNYTKISIEPLDSMSDNEDEDFDERPQTFRPFLDDKYPKLASLDKMILLVVYLIENTQNVNSKNQLRERDLAAISSNNSFQFIQQQIKDNINLRSTFNLIGSLCRLNDLYFPVIMNMIFDSIVLIPDSSALFFKILSSITEASWSSPYFAKVILPKIWDLADQNTLQTIDWLNQYVSRNKLLHEHVLSSLDNWVVKYLVENSIPRVRSSAAQLMICLVPQCDSAFRQNYRSFRSFPYTINRDIILSKEGLLIIDQLFCYLLRQIKNIRIFADVQAHGTQKLTNYFYLLTYFMLYTRQKRQFITHFDDFWALFQSKLSEPSIPIHQNKQAFLMFWYVACQECKESVKCIVQNPQVYKKIAFNYILADHDDQEVIIFNKNMLPYYYALLRICCENSRTFTRYLASHQNIQWAFKNITPYTNNYMLAIQELLGLIKIFSTVPEMPTENEIKEIQNFKTTTLKLYINSLDPNVHWGTIISVFKILISSEEDLRLIIKNNGLSYLFKAFSSLHVMFHQATACHITNELVDLLKIISSLLTTFENYYDELCHFKNSLKSVVESKKLIFLLNSYTTSNLRDALLEVLSKLIKVFPDEYLCSIGKFLLIQHVIFAEQGYPFTAGPYYPRRGQKTFQSKSSLRPTRPIFQMCFCPTNLESSSNLEIDNEYCRQILDFYRPYYLFVEKIVRDSIKNNLINNDLIDLIVKLSSESLYFHYENFVNFFIDIQENSEYQSHKVLDYIYSDSSFNDLIMEILMKERSFLANKNCFKFISLYLKKMKLLNISFIKNSQQIINPICSKRMLASKNTFHKLIWIDCEMTGLDVSSDKILEIGLILTDSNLNTIDQLGPIHMKTSQQDLDSMNDWCKKHFHKNNLVEECLKSEITIEDADKMLEEFMTKYSINRGILAGNSISTDRAFLDRYCPKFVSKLHYRMLDVSSIKILANIWFDDRTLWNKPTTHRALEDIKQSILELQYYRSEIFKKTLSD